MLVEHSVVPKSQATHPMPKQNSADAGGNHKKLIQVEKDIWVSSSITPDHVIPRTKQN